jgi:hypothetical protein
MSKGVGTGPPSHFSSMRDSSARGTRSKPRWMKSRSSSLPWRTAQWMGTE